MKRYLSSITALAIMVSLAIPSLASSHRTVHVAIQNLAFSVPVLHLKPGTTVIWTNQDSAGHTVTSGKNADDHLWKTSDTLNQGQSFSHTFIKAGKYPYYCIPHQTMSSMHAVVIVSK